MSEFGRSPEEIERSAEHEARHAEREAERAARHAERAEREAERSERHARRHEHGWRSAFGIDGDSEASAAEEKRLTVSGTPRVRVGNVSGETGIEVGGAGEVVVRARKRVRGWSEDRARRLLENVEIRIEQDGDEIAIEPRLFEQERGWLDLLRGGRVAVDLEVRVPQETHVEASTVSGELRLRGTRGQTELRSVSGDVTIDDVQGPLRVRTVSGDLNVTEYSGQLEANSVSGDIDLERSRVRLKDVVTVSGDVTIDAAFTGEAGSEARLRTVSGDIDLTLGETDVEVGFHTMSGDADVDGAARVEKEGRRDRRIVFGQGRSRLRAKTVSGDLSVRLSREARTSAAAEGADPEATVRMASPAMDVPGPGREEARAILERLARGELSVDAAAVALDDVKRR